MDGERLKARNAMQWNDCPKDVVIMFDGPYVHVPVRGEPVEGAEGMALVDGREVPVVYFDGGWWEHEPEESGLQGSATSEKEIN